MPGCHEVVLRDPAVRCSDHPRVKPKVTSIPAEDLRRELDEVTREEAEGLQHSVTLVEAQAPGAEIQAAYSRVEACRARKNWLLRELGLLEREAAVPRNSQPPSQRSGHGSAEALRELRQEERRRPDDIECVPVSDRRTGR